MTSGTVELMSTKQVVVEVKNEIRVSIERVLKILHSRNMVV